MTDGRGVLREIAWREIFPWLLIFRCFRLAIHPAILAVALVAAALTPIGWRLAHFAVFWQSVPSPQLREEEARKTIKAPKLEDAKLPAQLAAWQASHEVRIQTRVALWDQAADLTRFPGVGRTHDADLTGRLARPFDAMSTKSPIPYVFERFSVPILAIYRTATDLPGFTFYLLGTLWTLAIWGFGGGMITRIAAIEMGREEQANLWSVFKVALRRWFDFFSAPLYPVLGTFLIALLSMPVGWILYVSDAGSIVAGLLWIFVLLGGALSALMLLWLFIGWPLMWPAISAEETGDSFEAMSRSFAYAFQRPLHYLFYVLVAALLGFVGWSVVDFVCQLTLDATHWAVSWGAGHERMVEIVNYPPDNKDGPLALRIGSGMIRGVEGLLLALSEAFAYSFFWVAATAIYLVLRLNLDRTEFDEVWLEDEVDRFAGLPESPTSASEIPVPAKPDSTPDKPEPNAGLENNQAE